MDHGIIVQVGSPVEIYRAPATPFVADFVGTMNFLPGTAAGPRHVNIGDIDLECADEFAGLEPGSAVTVCVRPEDLTVRDAGREAPNAMRANVDDLEFLGAFYRATLAVEGMGEERLTADFAPNLVQSLGIRQGADLTVVFPDDRIRVFAAR
jgi:iron(III) transport system ATP-binding protein